jgi:hypothetical protein
MHAVAQELNDLLNRLFTGENRDLRIASLTLGQLRASVSRAQRNAFRAALDSISEHVQEGVACVEAGDQRFRHHVQCMLYIRISKAETAADDLKSYMLQKMEESEAGTCLHTSLSPRCIQQRYVALGFTALWFCPYPFFPVVCYILDRAVSFSRFHYHVQED